MSNSKYDFLFEEEMISDKERMLREEEVEVSEQAVATNEVASKRSKYF